MATNSARATSAEGVTGEVLVFARLPRLGVKTRLAAGVGAAAALALYEQCLVSTLRAAEAAAGPGGARVSVAAAADVESFARWAEHAAGFGGALDAQVESADLGDRLAAATAAAFARGARRVLVVGSDAPDLAPGTLAAAFDALDAGHDAVLGPAADGGYYLVGLARPAPALFSGVAWSTDTVYARTLELAAESGVRVAPTGTLPVLQDLDTAADLAAWARAADDAHPLQPLARAALGEAGATDPAVRA